MPENLFRNPEVKPDWAQLSRLAGDRAALRFEALRKRVGGIEGIREDLHYFGADWGWVPRYRLGERELFAVRILPGNLEGRMTLDTRQRAEVLSSGVAAEMKEMVRRAPSGTGVASLCFPLPSMRLVHQFVRIVLTKARLTLQEAPV